MAEKIGISYEIQSELMYMRDVIGLVAFAVEARRVLRDIDTVADGIPHIGETLGRMVDVRGQWTDFPDTAAAVLEEVHCRLDGLLKEERES